MERSLKLALSSLLLIALAVLSAAAIASKAGLTVPSNTTKSVANKLVSNGASAPPYLGITYLPITPEVAAYYGLTQQDGIYICEVANGSPAQVAGVSPNTVIIRFDGTTLGSDTPLVELLRKHQVGDSVKLSVVSPDSTGGKEVTVVLAATPGE